MVKTSNINQMKRLILCIVSAILLIVSCSKENQLLDKYSSVFRITDYFVEKLDTEIKSYGLEGLKYKKYTYDDEYSAFPTGRLIIVRIERVASDSEYDELLKALETYYSKDRRVNDVYRNNGGTIVVDCRN